MAFGIRIKLLKQGRDNRKSLLRAVPFLFTYLNAVFGFLSILHSLEGQFSLAAFYLFLAALMDLCDGRLARVFGTTSCFGMELDSLCDAISFCLAPVILVYCWAPWYVSGWGKLALALFLCAGLARLARFNLTAHEPQPFFTGVPTPVAAFLVAGMVLFGIGESHPFVVYFLIMAIAYAMISRIRFPSFKNKTR